MSATRSRTLPGPLDAAGGAAAWCRDTVRATAAVHHVDAAVAAACATRPRPPRLVPAPLLGDCLAQVVERRPAPVPAEPQPRRTRRVEPTTPAAGHAPDHPGSERRPRPPRVEPSEPAAPPGRVARPAVCPPDRLPAGPLPQGVPAPRVGTMGTVGTARLRALAGEQGVWSVRAAGGAGAAPRPPWPARRADVPGPARGHLATAREAGERGATLARRVAERLGGRVDVAALRRARVRATGPVDGLTARDLRALAEAASPEGTAATAPPGGAAPVPPPAPGAGPAEAPDPARRSRRARRRAALAEPAGAGSARGAVDPSGAPPERPAPRAAAPRADERDPHALARWAEPTARPPRLRDGPLADDAPAARGLAWTGTGPVTADARAATTALGLAEPDLELVMTRILDDAARRHGIEV